MKYLFFDTETSGLPRDYRAPMTDLKNWPRMVQIAWMLFDERSLLSEKDYIIRPIGFTIPREASDIHGITQARAIQEGVAVHDVLSEFKDAMSLSDYLVGHNIDFDLNIIGSEMIRDVMDFVNLLPIVDTMKESTDYCKLPAKWGYKWPKLSELHVKLFGEEFEGAHDALADIRATSNCFFELVNRNVICA